MQLKVERNRVLLVPESAPDELYLEAILGAQHGAQLLRVKDGDGEWGALALVPAVPKPKTAAPPAPESATEAAPS